MFFTTYVSTVCPHVAYAVVLVIDKLTATYNLWIWHILYIIATVCVVHNVMYLNIIESRTLKNINCVCGQINYIVMQLYLWPRHVAVTIRIILYSNCSRLSMVNIFRHYIITVVTKSLKMCAEENRSNGVIWKLLYIKYVFVKIMLSKLCKVYNIYCVTLKYDYIFIYLYI